jgi:hypothetical protein
VAKDKPIMREIERLRLADHYLERYQNECRRYDRLTKALRKVVSKSVDQG